jgi:twinkle protein
MNDEVVYEDPNMLDERGQAIKITKRDLLPNFVTPSGLLEPVRRLYQQGLPKGCLTGWPNLDEFYTIAPGQWTLVTGIPGSGKSEWLDALLVNVARRYDWRFALYSPENSPTEVHVAKLLEKYSGKPFRDGPTPRMNSTEVVEAIGWLEAHFAFVRPGGEQPASIDQILDECWTWIDLEKERPAGIVIDPWNELEHMRPERQPETEYISDTLSRLRRFARHSHCHVWIVAHPRILHRDRDGKRPIPTPYDVSGSAHWYNKADNCITIHRDQADPAKAKAVEVHVQKIRFKHIGKVGLAELLYDTVSGQYRPALSDASKRYREQSNGE